MLINEKNLEKILPHDYPMIVLDELLEVDMEKHVVTSSVTVREDKIFYDRTLGGISPLVGIEFMAQTVGCYAYFENGQKKPRIGYLLGSRQYNCSLEKFELGKTYKIVANRIFSDNELVSFDCFIYNDNIECARATVNVYLPQDVETLTM